MFLTQLCNLSFVLGSAMFVTVLGGDETLRAKRRDVCIMNSRRQTTSRFFDYTPVFVHIIYVNMYWPNEFHGSYYLLK
jgi:hypothetical protein